MANRSKADVERELEAQAVQVVLIQKEIAELEARREEPESPADLDDQIRRKTDELGEAQNQWTSLKAEAESAG
jgi:hypothetical protein